MKVGVRPYTKLGTHRFEYNIFWHIWALPFSVAVLTSWFPTETATIELDERWLTQRKLVVRVLCLEMRAVLSGPLFPDDDE